jgi:hypothetical protein
MDDLLEGEIEEMDEGTDEVTEPDAEEEEEVFKTPPPKATLAQLKKKTRVSKTITMVVSDEDGSPVEVSLTFRGIPAHEYDKLISSFPPRPKDKKDGWGYNPDKFGPAIVAATCVEPEMSAEDAKEIWTSDDWNRGERMQLLMAAIEVCTSGLTIPFRSSASE